MVVRILEQLFNVSSVELVITGFVQTNQTGFDYNGESNLDLQYAMTLVGRTQSVQLYQAGDDVEGTHMSLIIEDNVLDRSHLA